MTQKITMAWLQEMGACVDAREWGAETFKRRKEIEPIPLLNILIKADKLEWANWLIVRLMTHEQKVRYAIFTAEQVIGIYEKKYPDDKRPRNAIKAAKAWVENPTDKNKEKARAASAAVYAAYTDAAYAVTAAYAAYAAAAATAADETAADYAADAARTAVGYAPARKLRIKILKYGMKLLKESK